MKKKNWKALWYWFIMFLILGLMQIITNIMWKPFQPEKDDLHPGFVIQVTVIGVVWFASYFVIGNRYIWKKETKVKYGGK